MSRITVPITGKPLWATGDIRLWIELDLLLRDNAGMWLREAFRVDTGTDLTTFPAYLGRQLDLPMPQAATAGATHAQAGLEVRSGLLRFRIEGMDPADEHITSCLFRGDPDTPPDPGQPASYPRKLLQPAALLDRLRFGLAKDPAVGSLYGELVVEKV
jgi:hypothetical protein